MKTNGKFKVIAVVLTAMMLLSVMSMSAFAAAVAYTSVAGVEVDNDDYEVTVTYNAADVAEGDYVTVLVTVDSADLMFAEGDTTSPTNVIYVDQKAITEPGAGTFVFKVAKDIVANKDVFVKLGATNQATAAAGNKKFEVTTPGGEVLEVEINTEIGDAFGVDGLTSVMITPKTELPAGKAVLYDGKPMMVATYNIDGTDVVKYIALVSNFDKKLITTGDGEMLPLIYGDLDESEEVDIFDVTDALDYAMGAEIDDDAIKLAADVDGSGEIDIFDVTEILDIALDSSTLPTIVQDNF